MVSGGKARRFRHLGIASSPVSGPAAKVLTLFLIFAAREQTGKFKNVTFFDITTHFGWSPGEDSPPPLSSPLPTALLGYRHRELIRVSGELHRCNDRSPTTMITPRTHIIFLLVSRLVSGKVWPSLAKSGEVTNHFCRTHEELTRNARGTHDKCRLFEGRVCVPQFASLTPCAIERYYHRKNKREPKLTNKKMLGFGRNHFSELRTNSAHDLGPVNGSQKGPHLRAVRQ